MDYLGIYRRKVIKRGDTYLVEIKEYRAEGLMVYLEIANQTFLLPAWDIKDGIKQKHKKMIGWFIPVRIKSLRPLTVTNMRLDKKQLYKMGLNYYVTVVAEDREGKIIAASDSITAKV